MTASYERALRLFNVRPDEGGVAGTLFAFSFFIGITRVFTLTASQALFLDNYDASDLAYVYMLTAIATVATSTAYLRLGRVLPTRRLIVANLGFVLVVTLLLRVVLGASGSRWPAMALSVWFYVLFILTNLAFWAAATQIVDIRQGKRLFPVMATGEVVAFSFGGFLILPLVGVVGTDNLLLVAVGGLGAAIAIFVRLGRVHRDRFTRARAPMPGGGKQRRGIDWSSPYLRFMMGYVAASALAYVFVDNAFNDVAERRYSDVAQLAQFFGTYSAVTAIVNFLFRSFAAGRLIARFGVIAGLLGLPVAILIGSSLVGVVGAVLASTGIVFWLMTLTRMGDKVFRGVQASSMATLYQPLMEKGPAVQATMEGIVDATAMGVAGLLLFLLNNRLTLDATLLAFFLVALCLVWWVVTTRLKREYVRSLSGVLHRRRLSAGILDVTEDIRELVSRELDSKYPENVVYALDLLERSSPAALKPTLPYVLRHGMVEVKIDALRRVERHQVRAALDIVRELASDSDQPADIRGAATRTLCVVGEDEIDHGVDALGSSEPEVRRGAMVGLLLSGSVEGIVHAGAALLRYLDSADPDDRVFGAVVLAEAALPSFYRRVRQLLRDEDRRVRRAAVEAAARMKHPQLWLSVVKALQDPDLSTVAAEALVAAGADAIDPLMKGFEHYDYDRTLRLTVVRILGRIGDEKATRELYDMIGRPKTEIRHAALMALANRSFIASDEQIRRVEECLTTEAQAAARRLAAIADLREPVEASVVRDALGHEVNGIRHRMFMLLSFLYPGRDAMTAWNNYTNGDRDRRAYALELVDNFIAADLRDLVFPTLEDTTAESRLERYEHVFPIERREPAEWIDNIVEAPEGSYAPWTVQCARHVTKQMGGELREDVENNVVEETLRLKQVELFGEMAEPVLARIVPRLKHLALNEGDVVFTKGDDGDSLYIVTEGTVRVHDEGRTIATLGANQVFGEFTVLQSAERTATVSAASPVHLLRFEQDDLYELITDQVQIARHMIQIILRRLEENRQAREEQPERTSRVSISLKPLE